VNIDDEYSMGVLLRSDPCFHGARMGGGQGSSTEESREARRSEARENGL
jgi:hypothetical protein